MIEHFYEIFGYIILVIFLISIRWFVMLLNRWLDIENSGSVYQALRGIVEDAVLAIEEEARTAAPGNKPTSAQKRDLAIGFVTRMLTERGTTVPLDIIVGRIDAAVYRLINHAKVTVPY